MNRLKSAFFRCDASEDIGLGHLIRCIGLAQGLRSKGIKEIHFLCKDLDGRVRGLVRKYKFEYHGLGGVSSVEKDLEATVAKVKKLNLGKHRPVVVTDLYWPSRKYHSGLKKSGFYVVSVVDSLKKMRGLPSDIVVNCNYGAQKLKEDSVPGQKFLLGAKYFPCREEFLRGKDKAKRSSGRNILVTLGGGRSRLLFKKVFGAITSLGKNELRIVATVGLVRKPKVPAGLKVKCIKPEEDFSRISKWADLAITAGGITKYELAASGTPSIVISKIKEQDSLMQSFEREGTAVYLGMQNQVSARKIAEALRALLGNIKKMRLMKKKCRRLIDGKGAYRILKEIAV